MVIKYHTMGHAEMQEGWMFAEPSWCVRDAEGTIIAVFPGNSEVEAGQFAHAEAERTGDTVEKERH